MAAGEDMVGVDLAGALRLREAEVEVILVPRRPTHGEEAVGVDLDEGAGAVVMGALAVADDDGCGRGGGFDVDEPCVGEAVVGLAELVGGIH